MENAERRKIYVGCAGWSLPKPHALEFAGDGTHLERYAMVFNAVEINSSFYRPHQQKTYARWAESVPEAFRFSVKIPKAITHTDRLQTSRDVMRKFVDEVSGLGKRLGCWLVQLPPSLRFEAPIAGDFFEMFRDETGRCGGDVVCEPRHISWFNEEAEELLRSCVVGRVAADPAVVPNAARSGGARHTAYVRLHGSPRMYYSAYLPAQLEDYARQLQQLETQCQSVWCIFDNTAAGAAIENALSLQGRLETAVSINSAL